MRGKFNTLTLKNHLKDIKVTNTIKILLTSSYLQSNFY